MAASPTNSVWHDVSPGFRPAANLRCMSSPTARFSTSIAKPCDYYQLAKQFLNAIFRRAERPAPLYSRAVDAPSPATFCA